MNWAKANTNSFIKGEAEKAKKKHDKKNEGRKVKQVVVCKHPLTIKEIFVDDD